MSIQKIKTVTTVKWRELDDCKGYYVSNNGLVKKGNSLLTLRAKSDTGYLYVITYGVVNGKKTIRHHDVHKLVWWYFGDTPQAKGHDIHHKDRNFLNNHIDNLELVERLKHIRMHMKHGKYSKPHKSEAIPD